MPSEQSPEVTGDVRSPALPRPRAGRHAAPRKPVLQRLQTPVGRALALTAVPTALLMGTVTARSAFAADKTATASSPDTAPSSTGGSACGPTTSGTGTAALGRSSAPKPRASASAAPSHSPTATAPGSVAATPRSGAGGSHTSAPSASPTGGTQRTATADPSPSASASASASPSSSGGGLLDILDPLHLLHATSSTGGTASPSASATPAPTASATSSGTSVVGSVAKTVSGVTSSLTGSKGSTAGTTVHKAAGTLSGAASALGGTVSSAASTAADPAKLVSSVASAATGSGSGATSGNTSSRNCDISGMAAPRDLAAGEFPDVDWNLKATQLRLYNTVFHGVVTVQTTAGPKRVLKFTAEAIDIVNLKMNAYQGANTTLHIDGGPGSTSTMRTVASQQITMYVSKLTGTIAGVEGLPLPPILRVTLTPDTIPAWLYNIIGALNLKLQLTLDDVDIDQAGQTGGDLTIPGFHGYGVPTS